MKRVCRLGFLVLVSCAGLGGFSNPVGAQEGVANLPESPSPSAGSPNTDSLPGSERQPFNPSSEREATWRTLPRNFLHDQKDIWLFPVQLARGRYLVPT